MKISSNTHRGEKEALSDRNKGYSPDPEYMLRRKQAHLNKRANKVNSNKDSERKSK